MYLRFVLCTLPASHKTLGDMSSLSTIKFQVIFNFLIVIQEAGVKPPDGVSGLGIQIQSQIHSRVTSLTPILQSTILCLSELSIKKYQRGSGGNKVYCFTDWWSSLHMANIPIPLSIFLIFNDSELTCLDGFVEFILGCNCTFQSTPQIRVPQASEAIKLNISLNQ